jgi:hypothetical protein
VVRVLPALVGRHTFLRAFASLFLLELAALSGEWLVHQTEYLIVYGARFQQVMGASPHRLYIAPVGAALALAGLVTLSLCALLLGVRFHRYVHLLHGIPLRYRLALSERPLSLSLSSIGATAGVLAVFQIATYLIQENLEAAAQGLAFPGTAVLVSPRYITVVPLHLVVALCTSVLLWTLSSLCFRSRRMLDAVESLARRLARVTVPRAVLWLDVCAVPHRRLLRVARGLRSPPAFA